MTPLTHRTYPLLFRLGVVAFILGAIVVAFTLERPPVETVQRGYRGLGLVENYDPRLVARQEMNNIVPAGLPQASGDGPKAGTTYQNVKVLGDLSVGQFTRVMATITNWVSPTQGCVYCHQAGDFAAEGKYTKTVARRMLQMTRHINADWQTHVHATGVTCWTCHRGNPVPSQIWFTDPGPSRGHEGMTQEWPGKNHPAPVAGGSSLPADPLTPFLLQANNIRLQSTTALPVSDRTSIKQTEWTYALMFHFADSLGVNCTYCHNSRSWEDWSQSSPQRVTAWHGIRMVRDLNNDYLESVHSAFPAYRLGPTGDVPKVNCATCHQGAYKPLYGVSMLPEYPELAGPSPEPATTVSTQTQRQ
jgi:photosynthetic reaction center cytochrome c subunit